MWLSACRGVLGRRSLPYTGWLLTSGKARARVRQKFLLLVPVSIGASQAGYRIAVHAGRGGLGCLRAYAPVRMIMTRTIRQAPDSKEETGTEREREREAGRLIPV